MHLTISFKYAIFKKSHSETFKGEGIMKKKMSCPICGKKHTVEFSSDEQDMTGKNISCNDYALWASIEKGQKRLINIASKRQAFRTFEKTGRQPATNPL